ncbi:MAG: nif-specific transcriptional activator NifA [Desulfobacterales bacterium]|nr:nif-specific transcriptional activator NifA [Desulfobacterales bacterium]MDD4071732.1 nif-specific transcriptional activator NifA [Desulfobacterales bacterium]MDD4391694.1 nif-specific transcriptional activator NifA [Desulfobacterales bacterium]
MKLLYVNKKLNVHREVRELSLLWEVSQTLTRSIDLREVVGQVLNALAEEMGMSHGTLTLLNRKTGEIFIDVAHGLSENEMKKGRYKIGEGVTGKVVETGEPLVIPHVSDEPLFLNKTGSRKDLKKKDISFICVPIKIGNEVIGTLSADRLFDESVSQEEDLRLLSIIASMVAQAVQLRREVEEECDLLIRENLRLQNQLKERFHPSNIIGKSKGMQQVYELIAQVSKSSATVLIRGESGTGKELVANALHYNSLRANKPFIKVNCAALPETVLESELFGHEKGAFTGAISRRQGRFELAEGGTIFLDEVGDFPPTVQIKLLRVLQEFEYERIGGSSTNKADVRIIAATNRNLETLIKEEKFREDLYYRLNVFPIYIPPLRERKTDIPLLTDIFVERCAKANHKKISRISTLAIDMFMSYHWPGNVRELENCIERAVLLSNDGVIHGYHLPPSLQTSHYSGTAYHGTMQWALDNLERDLIMDALKTSKGNAAKACKILGITERILGLRISKYQLDPKRFRILKK